MSLILPGRDFQTDGAGQENKRYPNMLVFMFGMRTFRPEVTFTVDWAPAIKVLTFHLFHMPVHRFSLILSHSATNRLPVRPDVA